MRFFIKQCNNSQISMNMTFVDFYSVPHKLNQSCPDCDSPNHEKYMVQTEDGCQVVQVRGMKSVEVSLGLVTGVDQDLDRAYYHGSIEIAAEPWWMQ